MGTIEPPSSTPPRRVLARTRSRVSAHRSAGGTTSTSAIPVTGDTGAPEGVAEAIRTSQAAGVRLQVSHLVPRSGDAEMERCLELVDEAGNSSLDVAFDMHTRLFGFTYLYSVLPPWALANGMDGLRSVLENRDARRRMKGFRSILSAGGDWDHIVLLDPRRLSRLRPPVDQSRLQPERGAGGSGLDLRHASRGDRDDGIADGVDRLSH